MKYKRELFYTILMFVALELASLAQVAFGFWMVAVVGALVLFTWLVTAFVKYSARKVSKYSDVMIRVGIKARWYTYLFVPVVFYLSIALFVFSVKDDFLKQFAILVGLTMMYLLMIHIRSSYSKVYSVTRVTRIVFDLVNVMFFFLVQTSMILLGFVERIEIALFAGLLVFLILISNLRITGKSSMAGYGWALGAAALVGGLAMLLNNLSLFSIPFVLTLAFYMIVSFWHLRLAGENKLDKYLQPILFTLMAIIIVVG